ncbi:unnamed protein product [Blepharisma stoltei]|uniref:Uncharacterized protein n=1 Tax=Blepharisma stoltei TaxID=1481888 RepID=A0AAU9JL91_9CILI|nr:unnamed protein product [Blepharisma stoltei]
MSNSDTNFSRFMHLSSLSISSTSQSENESEDESGDEDGSIKLCDSVYFDCPQQIKDLHDAIIQFKEKKRAGENFENEINLSDEEISIKIKDDSSIRLASRSSFSNEGTAYQRRRRRSAMLLGVSGAV